MAIEDEDIKDREHWTAISRDWYTKAAGRQPTIGRLYHHLAILSRPHALQQLFFYAKSLAAPIPFPSARESIMTLFDPILKVSTKPAVLDTRPSLNQEREMSRAISSQPFVFQSCIDSYHFSRVHLHTHVSNGMTQHTLSSRV